MVREDLPGEFWKDVGGFFDYEVSNMGRVWSRKTQKVLSAPPNSNGYPAVCLREDGKSVSFCVHILVARHFICGHSGAEIVCHKNGNSHNNEASNLYWGTYEDNMRDAQAHGSVSVGKYSQLNEGPGRHSLTLDQTRGPT